MYQFTIGKVAASTGLAASAIRYYESLGLVPKPFRVNGRRVYDERWMKKLGFVLLAKEAGFTIKEIQQLSVSLRSQERPPKLLQEAADGKIIEISKEIRRLEKTKALLGMIASCGCNTMEECGTAALEQQQAANI
ncbi:MAG: MerR family transcriptional regulator [Kordiimonadaceae bacterium]|nr:MerR family transcriptional regulator [Kordiimonadaceae bacterium]